MNARLKSLVMAFVAGAVITGIIQPAHAQYMGRDCHETKVVANTDSPVATEKSSPAHDSITPSKHAYVSDPDCSDATVISGVNSSGTVRVNMLANLEALLNICGNGAQIIGLIWGSLLLWACFRKFRQPGLVRSLAFAMLPIILGLCTPGSINWAIVAARDANLFS